MTDEQQKADKRKSPVEGKMAPFPKKTKEGDSPEEQRNFLKIMQLFPDLDTILLRKIYEKCDRDFIRTLDNILYVKRYCVFMKLMKTFNQELCEPKIQTYESATSQTGNQDYYLNGDAEMPVYSQIHNYSTNDCLNNVLSPYEQCNSSYNSSQMYQSYNSGSYTLYDSSNSTSDPFYNSHDINSSQSSLYNSNYLSNGSMDEMNLQLNSSLNDTYGNNSYCFYDPFANLPGNFRASTPDIMNIISDTFINQSL